MQLVGNTCWNSWHTHTQLHRNIKLHTDPTEENENALLSCAVVAGTDVTVEVTAVTVFTVPCPVTRGNITKKMTAAYHPTIIQEGIVSIQSAILSVWNKGLCHFKSYVCTETFLMVLQQHRIPELFWRCKAITYLIKTKRGLTIDNKNSVIKSRNPWYNLSSTYQNIFWIKRKWSKFKSWRFQ